jgi:16S rRNA (guanine(966)-N(2))-methyltransferase RsmD
MRIIAGTHKGRRLLGPKDRSAVRPTSGRVKEALFSILGTRIVGASVLDLYAGTGAVGIEALSRGASRVVFVESHRDSLTSLHANLKHCGLTVRAEVFSGEAAAFLRQAAPAFDVVFLDPPYATDGASSVLPSLSGSAIIRDGTIVILEHLTKHDIPQHIGPLNRVKQYRYGDTSLSLFRVDAEERRTS